MKFVFVFDETYYFIQKGTTAALEQLAALGAGGEKEELLIFSLLKKL